MPSFASSGSRLFFWYVTSNPLVYRIVLASR